MASRRDAGDAVPSWRSGGEASGPSAGRRMHSYLRNATLATCAGQAWFGVRRTASCKFLRRIAIFLLRFDESEHVACLGMPLKEEPVVHDDAAARCTLLVSKFPRGLVMRGLTQLPGGLSTKHGSRHSSALRCLNPKIHRDPASS